MNRPTNVIHFDHGHAGRNRQTRRHFDWIETSIPIFAADRAVCLPASSLVTTGHGPVYLQIAMVRIFDPLTRFAPASDHDARTILEPICPGRDGRCQMHRKRHRADHTSSMVHEPAKLPRVRLSDQVYRATQRLVPVARLSALDELNAAGEGINYSLVTVGSPPFTFDVELATCHHDPEIMVPLESEFRRQSWPEFLFLGQINVTFELSDWYPNS